MYHCQLKIYLMGHSCRTFDMIKEKNPPENFTYSFLESGDAESGPAAEADVIFANMQGKDAPAAAKMLVTAKKDETQLILLVEKEQIAQLADFLAQVTDIWTLPMTDEETAFRLERWQRLCRMDRDFWQTRQYLDATINGVPNLVWYKDKEGIHEKVNDSFCRTVNKTREQVEGRDHFYIWDVDPDDPDNAENDCNESDGEAMRRRETCVSEEVVKTGDGEKLFTTYKSPLYDLDGSVMGTVGVGIDVTQERAYEQELINKSHTLETIFTKLDCGVLCHTLDGTRILSVNDAALSILGYESEKELTAGGFDMVATSVMEEDKPKLRECIASLKKVGDSSSVEYRVQHKDGKVLHVMGSIKLLEENGEPFYQRFLLDCTAQKMQEKENERRQMKLLEDALEQANKANQAKSAFLSNMSHDIRTPMNAIVGFTMLAIAHIDRKEQVEEYLEKIMTSGNHLLSLINDVLDMSRIESGKMQIEETPCNLSDILHGLHNIVQADAQAKQLELHISAADIVNEEIYCDKLRLNQVLLNIVSNSIKYTNEGGSVSLRLTEKPSAKAGYADYEFYLKDTGIGMNEEFLAHVFEPFEREKNTTASGVQGTGLGMAITKNIVDMMNGFIDVKSQPDQGTEVTVRFTFRLNSQAEKSQEMPEFAGCRALVVDDDLNACDNISHMLTQLGMRAEWACAGEEAIARTHQAVARRKPYRVYVIDSKLPDMSVPEIASRLKAETGAADVIIVVAAYEWSDMEEEAKAAGVTTFCGKPLFLSELRNRLNAVTGKTESVEKPLAANRKKLKVGRILLAEDNELNQEIAQAILGDAGFSVEIAGNGQIAVDMLKKSEPGYYGLILMDVQMPVMSGYEATEIIRGLEDKQLASIPILAMTANAFEEDKQKALQCGMNGHIAKPIDVDKLFGTLGEILG